MKIKLFFLFALLFTSANALASTYCTASDSHVTVSFGDNIYIPPDTKIGEIIATSDKVVKSVTCYKQPYRLVTYTDTSQFKSTGIIVKLNNIDCEVAEIGYSGLGIAWIMHNSYSGVYMCATAVKKANIRQGIFTRGINPKNGIPTVYTDQIF